MATYLFKMDTSSIKVILIVVELENGNAHQVLSSVEHKKLGLDIIAGLDGKLHLSEQIEGFKLEPKKK